MKYISQIKNIKGKIVLLRADLNSNFVKGKIIRGERIKCASETIKFLKKKGARVVVIAHQGRPEKDDCVSLRVHARLLSKYTKVRFVKGLFDKKIELEIKNLKNGEAILLENLRKFKEEYSSSGGKFVKNLSFWCDIYVNDAFSNSHRGHASMVGFAKKMKSYAGLLLEKELNALKKIHLGKTLYILGGAKPEDCLILLGRNKVLGGGLFGQMCLVAREFKFGAQEKYLKKTIKDFDKIKKKLKPKLRDIILPVDFGVKINRKRKNLELADFPSRNEIFDIGPKTRKIFLSEIKKAKSIYMKGPVGDFSNRGFEKGTFEILRAISKSRAFSLIGGGHLSDALRASKISEKKFGHVSLSGGALLKFIVGEKLPGIEVLK